LGCHRSESKFVSTLFQETLNPIDFSFEIELQILYMLPNKSLEDFEGFNPYYFFSCQPRFFSFSGLGFLNFEAEMANLSSRRALKATAIRKAARLKHPMKQALEDEETYNWYATKPNHIKPFFIRAIDACASLGI
jgi:hypothetical protein